MRGELVEEWIRRGRWPALGRPEPERGARVREEPWHRFSRTGAGERYLVSYVTIYNTY
jgi:hypothetical protein